MMEERLMSFPPPPQSQTPHIPSLKSLCFPHAPLPKPVASHLLSLSLKSPTHPTQPSATQIPDT